MTTNSICTECNEETKFQWTTSSETWAECLSCGKKFTKIANHRFSPQITDEMIILSFDQEEEQEQSFDSQVKKAERIAELEEELNEDIEDKVPLLEKERPQTRREVENYFEDDHEDEYDDEEPVYTQRKEPPVLQKYQIHTEILREVLTDYGCNKKFIQDVSRKSEQNRELLDSKEVRHYFEIWDAGTKSKGKIRQIIDAYDDALFNYYGDNKHSVDDRRFSRHSVQETKPQNFTEFYKKYELDMEYKEKEREWEKIQERFDEQLDDKDGQIDVAQYQAEEYKKKVERIEEELKDIKREHKSELKEKDAEIKALENRLFDARLAEVKVQASQSFSTDGMKLLDKAIDRGVGTQLIQTITDRPMPKDSRIGQSNVNQDAKTREFEVLTNPRPHVDIPPPPVHNETREIFQQQINYEDLIVEEDE